jgi:hypothetical protein
MLFCCSRNAYGRLQLQIAAEETEDNTIYAADDRAAAQAEFDQLKEAYENAIQGPQLSQSAKEEIRRRAGQRIRELESALRALEEKAQSQD